MRCRYVIVRRVKRLGIALLGSMLLVTSLAPSSQANHEGVPQGANGEYLSIAGTQLNLPAPQRLLIPVTLPAISIANLPGGVEVKPAGVVQFRWLLCKKPVFRDNSRDDCFLMGTPAQADGKRAFQNVNVSFTKTGGVWRADPVKVPFDPRDMPNLGQGLYLSPLALVASVRADGSSAQFIQTTEFQPNPQSRGVEITSPITRPFSASSMSLTTDKTTYSPTDNIVVSAVFPRADFTFIPTAGLDTAVRQTGVIFACTSPVTEVPESLYARGGRVPPLEWRTEQGRREAPPTCEFLDVLGSTDFVTRQAPWIGVREEVTDRLEARTLVGQALQPGESVTYHVGTYVESVFEQTSVEERTTFYWGSGLWSKSTPITITNPAGAAPVAPAQNQGAAGNAAGLNPGAIIDADGPAATGTTSSEPAVGGTLAEAGVDLTRAPVASKTGSASVGSTELSVKVSKKPRRGKAMKVSSTIAPQSAGTMTYALAYVIEGREVVVRVKKVPVTSTQSSVSWKLKKKSPKGRYIAYASFVPTDASKTGITVSRPVRVR